MNKDLLPQNYFREWNKLMASIIKREQEELAKLPDPPDGYEYRWTEHTQMPTPPDFVAGWKLYKKHD
jgi:hypothetical protein